MIFLLSIRSFFWEMFTVALLTKASIPSKYGIELSTKPQEYPCCLHIASVVPDMVPEHQFATSDVL